MSEYYKSRVLPLWGEHSFHHFLTRACFQALVMFSQVIFLKSANVSEEDGAAFSITRHCLHVTAKEMKSSLDHGDLTIKSLPNIHTAKVKSK